MANRSCHVSCLFMNAACNSSQKRIRATCLLASTVMAVELASAIKNGFFSRHLACRMQISTCRTAIPIVTNIEHKVATTKRFILAPRLVPYSQQDRADCVDHDDQGNRLPAGVGSSVAPEQSKTLQDGVFQTRLQRKSLMANRSNRHWQNPTVSEAAKPEEAIGS